MYLLVSTIVKVMTQLQMLYSCWIKILLLPQSLYWLLGFGTNHNCDAIELKVGNEIVVQQKSAKLLGITFDDISSLGGLVGL